MATRIIAVSPGGHYEDVIETVGPTATSAVVAIVVDLATTAVTDGATTRAVNKQEVLSAIETMKRTILKMDWPPA